MADQAVPGDGRVTMVVIDGLALGALARDPLDRIGQRVLWHILCHRRELAAGPVAIPHGALADELAMRAPLVSRAMAELCRRGILDRPAKAGRSWIYCLAPGWSLIDAEIGIRALACF